MESGEGGSYFVVFDSVETVAEVGGEGSPSLRR
jgi:hypothetical protein